MNCGLSTSVCFLTLILFFAMSRDDNALFFLQYLISNPTIINKQSRFLNCFKLYLYKKLYEGMGGRERQKTEGEKLGACSYIELSS